NTEADPLYTWFDADHQSRAGWTAPELLSTYKHDDPHGNHTPDIAVIMIGNNDLAAHFGIPATITKLGELVTELRTRNPNVKLVVTQLLPNPERMALTQQYNEALAQFAADIHTAASPAVLVDQYTGFNNATDTFDNPAVHPNEIGEKKIANKYYDALVPLLGGSMTQPQPPEQPVFGRIIGYVFDDANRNGARDTGEAAQVGRYVYLDHNDNGKRDPDEQITVTSRLGRYLF